MIAAGAEVRLACCVPKVPLRDPECYLRTSPES